MMRRGVWEVLTWIGIAVAFCGGWSFVRGLFYSGDERQFFLAVGGALVVMAIAVGSFADSKVQEIVEEKNEKLLTPEGVGGRLLRVGLSHPLDTLGIRSENIAGVIRWRRAIDNCQGLICFAPWVVLAESDPRGQEKQEGGAEWVRKVIEFDIEVNRRCDVVVVVTRKLWDGKRWRRLISKGQEEEAGDLILNSRPRIYVGENRLGELEANPENSRI